jgi:hypothetical protein
MKRPGTRAAADIDVLLEEVSKLALGRAIAIPSNWRTTRKFWNS